MIETPPTPVLVSLAPQLTGGGGHDVDYHRATGEAAASLGWEHRAIVSKSADTKGLPAGWTPALETWRLRPGADWAGKVRWRLERRAANPAAALRSWSAVLPPLVREIREGGGEAILFIEVYTVSQLAALVPVVAAMASRRPCGFRLWVLYRYSFEQLGRYGDDLPGRGGAVCKKINQSFAALLGDRFRLLTDSALLEKSLSEKFGMPVREMPIPHLDLPPAARPRISGDLRCWWPGRPDAEKGLETIRRLLACSEPGAEFATVALSERARLTRTPGGPVVAALPGFLTREEYSRQFELCDVVLLPYQPEAYRQNTSGILVETVWAGRLPLTTPGTWMAHELGRFGLEQLCCDWTPEGFFARLEAFLADSEIRAKLDAMRTEYGKAHGVPAFAKALAEVHST